MKSLVIKGPFDLNILFQDELKAAVSARSRTTEMDQYSYSDDFSDAEDGKTGKTWNGYVRVVYLLHLDCCFHCVFTSSDVQSYSCMSL